ncbi:DUF1444 domain-containing protein [Calidifontibacillus oryziterrae]|uniref:DUF1444 domain-containing protein n=1 Tax=Calidifontibacillus oryziterrae TaxID=1191699 RepID=UPI000477DE90
MTNAMMKNILVERLQRERWNIVYDHTNFQLRIESKVSGKGITISLPPIISKWEEKKEKAIDEVVYNVEEALKAMEEPQKLGGKEKHIFPVLRSTSFPTETKDGKKLIFDEHTAETRIYFALDLGTSYRLIDRDFAIQENWSEERIKEVARFNVRSLKVEIKEDDVAENHFYFINTNDGYDASRVLNESLLEKIQSTIKGTMVVAIPHQDVLIIGDICNEQGYKIVGHMAMQFFTEGRVPITALPFLYENKELEPIFVLVNNKLK